MAQLRTFISILIVISSFSLTANDIDTQINQELEKIKNTLNQRGVRIEELISQEESLQEQKDDSLKNKEILHSLLKDFIWQLETEKYLYEQGSFCAGFLAMGTCLVAASYGLSYLQNMGPSCIMDACESGHAPILTSSDFVCAPDEIAYVCLNNMKKMGVRHLSQFAKYSRECFPGLDPALDGQPIKLGKIMTYVNPLCRITTQSMLMAPTVITGGIGGLFLIAGCGSGLYNSYLRFLLRKFSRASYPNDKSDDLIANISGLYANNFLIIELVIGLLLKKDEALNLSWKKKDRIHAANYFSFPDKKNSKKAQ